MNKSNRDLATLIRCMLVFIPVECKEFRNRLNAELQSVLYTAPECMGGRFLETAAILEFEIPDIEFAWVRAVKAIWMEEQDDLFNP